MLDLSHGFLADWARDELQSDHRLPTYPLPLGLMAKALCLAGFASWNLRALAPSIQSAISADSNRGQVLEALAKADSIELSRDSVVVQTRAISALVGGSCGCTEEWCDCSGPWFLWPRQPGSPHKIGQILSRHGSPSLHGAAGKINLHHLTRKVETSGKLAMFASFPGDGQKGLERFIRGRRNFGDGFVIEIGNRLIRKDLSWEVEGPKSNGPHARLLTVGSGLQHATAGSIVWGTGSVVGRNKGYGEHKSVYLGVRGHLSQIQLLAGGDFLPTR